MLKDEHSPIRELARKKSLALEVRYSRRGSRHGMLLTTVYGAHDVFLATAKKNTNVDIGNHSRLTGSVEMCWV